MSEVSEVSEELFEKDVHYMSGMESFQLYKLKGEERWTVINWRGPLSDPKAECGWQLYFDTFEEAKKEYDRWIRSAS